MRLIASFVLVLLGAVAPAARAAEDFAIQAILPLTGPAAFVGGGEKEGIEALQEIVNTEGGIAGRKLKIVFHDDQTSPQVAVQLLNDVMAAHPAVVLGSTITTMCNAMAPLVADGPVMYCFSPGVHPQPGAYEFSAGVSTIDLAAVLVRYFRERGWTRLALIVSTDATGQDAENGINHALALPENKSVTMAERAHFNPGDVSVAAQIATVAGAKPQALIAWTTGTALATILKGVVQAGLDIPVATTNGNMSVRQLSQYADFAPNEFYIPAPYFPPHDGVKLDPRVEKEQQDMYKVMAARKLPVDMQTTNGWDPTLMVVAALRKLGTDVKPAALRQYLAGQTDFAGTSGIYNFKAVPQRGLTEADAVVTRWNGAAKRFDWVAKPGGAPLAK
jgi:branched-chain amino acid transport system substrate-binding protein